MTAIVAIIIYGGIGLTFLWILFGKQIIAFFSPTPQHKCEVSVPASASAIYCREDGTQGNRNEDECLAKGSNYEYDSEKLVCKVKETTVQKQPTNNETTRGKYTCVDVTSYDYNWDNDMLCTSPSGKQFYTSYEHADLLINGDPSEKHEGWEDYDNYDYDY